MCQVYITLGSLEMVAGKLTFDTVWAREDFLIIPVVGEHFVTGSEATEALDTPI